MIIKLENGSTIEVIPSKNNTKGQGFHMDIPNDQEIFNAYKIPKDMLNEK